LRIGKPLPFADRSFDVAYLLHVLEHQTPEEQMVTLRETWRVLKPGGWLRASVPDQEEKGRIYLQQLARVRADSCEINHLNYEWAVMNLFDQMVRRHPGGAMARALRRGAFDPGFIRACFGDALDPSRPDKAPPARPKLHGLNLSVIAARYWRRLLSWWYRGDPRHTGEADLWGHDEVWLGDRLRAAGFIEVERTDFERSGIPAWDRFALDHSELGNYPLEPSLFMEARKPCPP
jgi:SAM-dependent methyltransferase